jgi:hypothetical protein
VLADWFEPVSHLVVVVEPACRYHHTHADVFETVDPHMFTQNIQILLCLAVLLVRDCLLKLLDLFMHAIECASSSKCFTGHVAHLPCN